MKNEIWEKVITFLMTMFRNAAKSNSTPKKLCRGKEKAGDITKRICKDRGITVRRFLITKIANVN